MTSDSPLDDELNLDDEAAYDHLMVELRTALPPDPIPDAVHRYALASLGLRALGLEIGTVLFDSLDDELVGVRAASSTTRSLSVALKEFVVDLQIDGNVINGRMRPFPAGVGISIVTTPLCQFVSVDSFGEFRAHDVPVGPLRIELQLNGEAAATSEWILRPTR